MGTIDLPPPSVGPLSRLAPKPIRFVLNWGRRYSLWVFNFGLACCAIEFIATSMSRHDFIRLGVIPFAPGPRQADLMVVSGTVSDKMAPAVRRLYEQMPEPKYVISFGACSNCGGPYWDSYCVTKGVDQIIPVDVYVPGCPPRPEALLHGIVHLQEKIAAESLGDRYGGEGAGREPVAPPPAPRPFTATVLRRPLQPPPPPDQDETFEHWSGPAEDDGRDDEAAGDMAAEAAAAEAAAVEHEAAENETLPVPHLGEAEVPAGPGGEAPPARPTDVTVPVRPLGEAETPAEPEPEAEPVRATDTTQPVRHLGEAGSVAEHEPGAPPVEPTDVTQPVRPVGGTRSEPEAPPVLPTDTTQPVHMIENEPLAAPVPPAGDEGAAEDRRAARDEGVNPEHDPSIIPGLVDDEHDDQIGRDR
nr:NADH-quinone oxidoreductase subunit NuoB [Actinomadura sp. WMMA1423]